MPAPHDSPFGPAAADLFHLRRVAALATLLSMSLALPALAQDKEAAYGLSGSLGVGAVAMPTYEGSPNRRIAAGPVFTLSYRSREWGSVELGQRGLMWQAFEAGDFRLGLVAGLDPGRKARDTATADPTPGDKRLAGMGVVRASAEAGLAVGYGPVMLLTRQALGTRGHQGAQAELSVEFPWAVSSGLGLRASASATWADAKYQQAYFGVTPAQARATRFGAFTPRAGLRKAELSLAGEYTLLPAAKLGGGVTASRLTGDAAKSPLVARKSGYSAFLALAYEF